MKHTTFLAATAAVAFSAIDAAWTDVQSSILGATVDNSNPDAVVVRWPQDGTPGQADPTNPANQSSYTYARAGLPFSPDPNTPFSLGTFTHDNQPIPNGSGITAANLSFTFGGTADGSPEVTFDAVFNFFHNETPNDPPAPACCDDIVTVGAVGGADEVVVVGNKKYTFTLLGFSTDGGFTFSNVFNSPEGSTNSANLYAKYTVSIIPLPAAGWLMLGGLGALGAVARRRRKAA